MKIAYIVDSSTKLNSKYENVFKIPFMVYNQSGSLIKTYDSKLVRQHLDSSDGTTKSYIEPTPGMYRDLYNDLSNSGFDHIIVIPNQSDKSISYRNAEYASRISNVSLTVVESDTLNASIGEVIDKLLSKKIIENSKIVSLDKILDVIIQAFKSLNLLLN